MMEKQVIPIDPDGRYIILVKGGTTDSSLRLAKAMEDWWGGEGKFFVLTLPDDVEVILERLEDD